MKDVLCGGDPLRDNSRVVRVVVRSPMKRLLSETKEVPRLPPKLSLRLEQRLGPLDKTQKREH